VLREAAAAVTDATTDGRDQLDPQLLADLRNGYDRADPWGITTNQHHDWAQRNHPECTLAHRLAAQADMSHHHLKPRRALDEQRLRAGPQRPETTPGRLRLLAHADHTHRILPRPLYLVSTRGHHIPAIHPPQGQSMPAHTHKGVTSLLDPWRTGAAVIPDSSRGPATAISSSVRHAVGTEAANPYRFR
jgi:hypothetical protein